MKFTTTSAALAVAATGAAAQDSWSAWESAATSNDADVTVTKTCPGTITAYKTATATAYEVTSEVFEHTVTVPIPDEPATVEIKADWAEWKSTSSAAETFTEFPYGCPKDGKTVTETTTITSTKAGTTTVTHSTLFVAAKVTGSADEAWANWNPDKDGSSSDSDVGSGNGNGWNGNGHGSDDSDDDTSDDSKNHNGNGWNGNGDASDDSDNNGWNHGGDQSSDDSSNSGLNGNSGWGKGSWGGKGTGGKNLGNNDEVFHWDDPVPTETKSGAAPHYTKNPDGSYGGTPYGDVGHWGDWNGPDDSDNGDGKDGHGGKGNGTSPDNGEKPVYPPFGDKGSNVTKPFEPSKGGFGGYNRCNSAEDRSKWCDGKDTDTDYYKDYFTGRQCSYDLVITNGTWNSDGKEVPTFLINGQYPGPAIECNWGDDVVINVHNKLQTNGTAIHWHGVRQKGTNDQDGVPGVTECAIAPGESRSYSWKASSYGTSWYHSHWNLQYGDGVQGPIIIHGPATANYDIDAGPVMITDTYGMTATAFGNLITHRGPLPVDNYLLNGKNTRPDLSAGQHALWKVQKGKKYLFRFINSAAQNMYSLSIDQHKFKVIAADFVPIVPYETEWLNIGIGQRYDCIVEMNQAVSSYFLRAVTQTLCPSASNNTGLGSANGIIAYEGVSESPLELPTSTLNGNKTAAAFRICADEPLNKLAPHLKKGAGTSSAFQASVSTLPGGTVGRFATADDGNVFRWFLNNGAMFINYTQPTLSSLAQDLSLNSSVYANPITLQQKDQWVYFVIQNQFLASHPMHLHGHDFSVLGEGFGTFTADKVSTLNFDNPIRRDTAMLKGNDPAAGPPPIGPNGLPVASGGYTVIGFETDNPGAWLMHCHIAWHVDGGLALQWLERPEEIHADAYTSKASYKNECSAYASYEAANPSGKKLSSQSGLKRRDQSTYFDRLVAEMSRSSVVRRDDAAHHYLESHLKRGLGDGGHRRSFGRRR